MRTPILKNLLSASGQDHWNSSEHVMGTPDIRQLQRAWSLLKWLHRMSFLAWKHSYPETPLSLQEALTFPSRQSHSTLHFYAKKPQGALLGLLKEESPRGQLAEFLADLSHFWETMELFNQPCSTEHILNPCLLS